MNTKKPSKISQINQHSEFIRKKREEILEKQKAMQLVQSMKSNKDDTKNVFSNDGSFLENFKKITQQAKQQATENIDVQMQTNDQAQSSGIPQAGFSGIQQSSMDPLIAIPVPREIDLTAIPKPIMKLDEIKIPDNTFNSVKVFSDQIQNVEQLIEMVAENDTYEDNFIRQNNELQSSPLWFLLDKNSDQYLSYRKRVLEKRSQMEKYDPADIYQFETQGNLAPKTFGSNDVVRSKTVNMTRNDDSDSTNSDTEYMKEAKERNLKNLKHKALTSWKRKQKEMSSTDSDSDKDDDNSRFYGKYKNSSSSSSLTGVSCEKESLEQQGNEHSSNRPKRKKSRWGPQSSSTSSSSGQPSNTQMKLHEQQQQQQHLQQLQQPIAQVILPQQISIQQTVQQLPKLTSLQRSDPALLNYVRLNYGTTNLSEEDWKKAEEHFKINLLYQDMLKKRQELDMLAKSNKFKHEYDSDEDCTNGTWEHKLRSQEMEATTKWAEALNKQAEGKHHIGDYLPPEELKKFMEKYSAQKSNRQPDISDYKEYKLKEDNIGFQMLQKLGWKPGAGLGAEGNGIVDPVNKATQRDGNQGLGATSADAPNDDDNEYDAYRKRMMLAYRFRPNPLNNPRRAYY